MGSKVYITTYMSKNKFAQITWETWRKAQGSGRRENRVGACHSLGDSGCLPFIFQSHGQPQ